MHLVILNGLERQGDGSHGTGADARNALRAGEVLTVGLSHGHDRYSAVSLRIHDLHPRGCVARVSSSVEDRVGIVLLWFMVKDKHNLATGIDGGVVIVAELGGGDTVAGKDDGRSKIHRMFVSAYHVRSAPTHRLAGTGERYRGSIAIGAIFDEGEWLQVGGLAGGIVHRRLDAGFSRLGGAPVVGQL